MNRFATGLLTTVLMVGTLPSLAVAQQNYGEIPIIKVQSGNSIADYWTRWRMKNARPLNNMGAEPVGPDASERQPRLPDRRYRDDCYDEGSVGFSSQQPATTGETMQQRAKRIQEYWTPERMRNAKPRGMGVVTEKRHKCPDR